jgi:cation diffusion facilitator CzcD-associated flavoprotein CzcO
VTPATQTPRVVIIGAGFGGLCMAIRLQKAGNRSFTILERGDDVGGVWRDNTYPGAACDVPSHLYEFSFEPNPDWSRRYAPQPEILAYLRHCADRYGLRPHIRFNTEVVGAAFDETRAVWQVRTAQDQTHEAEVLVTATGQLSRPAIPPIPGLESFAGVQFHSACWNHDHDLTDRKVAVVGTGASAIQFVPQIATAAKQLTVFQLDAPHVLPKIDYPYPALATTVLKRLPLVQRLSRWTTYWHLEKRALGFTRFPQLMAPYALQVRHHIRRKVSNPELRETITPTDAIGCKRVLISNDWYPALTRHNVEVVTSRITEIRPHTVVTDEGTEHEVDTLIYGTGFQATDLLAPMQITGLGGRKLAEVWREGAEAHLGITVSGFPNLFLLYGPNTNLGHSSIVFMLEAQVGYVLQAIEVLAQGAARWLEVRAEVQEEFNARVQERIRATVWDRGCMSWYKTASGKNTINWPDFTFVYWLRTRRLNIADYRLAPVV